MNLLKTMHGKQRAITLLFTSWLLFFIYISLYLQGVCVFAVAWNKGVHKGLHTSYQLDVNAGPALSHVDIGDH